MIRPRRSHAAALAVALALHSPSVAQASWASDGNLVVGVAGSPVTPTIVAGATGDVFMAWVDNRPGFALDLRASRWITDGTAAVGWTRDGDLVGGGVCYKYDPCATPDGVGGVLYAWSAQGCLAHPRIYATRVLPAGATACPITLSAFACKTS